MIDIYNNLLSLLTMIEIDYKLVKIKLVKLNSKNDIWFLYNQFDHTQQISEMKTVSLDKLVVEDIYPFTSSANDEHDLNSFIEALEDRSLAILLHEFRSLASIKASDQDINSIVSNINNIDDIVALSYEYIEYEEYIFDILARVGYEYPSLVHEEIINKEVKRIVGELKELKSETLGCEKAVAILKEIAKKDYNIDTCNPGLNLVHAGSLEYSREGVTDEKYQLASALWFVFLDTDGVYENKIRSLPIWAIELFKLILPNAMKSSSYLEEIKESDVFKTALDLNEDGGLYADFDTAFEAANALLK